MGFSIWIGPLDIEDGEVSVKSNNSLSNVFSLSYSVAHDYFNSTSDHKQLWSLLRDGDIDGADSVIVKLTQQIVNLIDHLSSELYIDLDNMLLNTLDVGCKMGKDIYIMTR
jgi:hypothetical protein